MVVAVPLQVLIHVGGLPIHCDGQCIISLWFEYGVQEGNGIILLVVLHCKPYGWVNSINVFQEVLFVLFLLDDKCVIHIPEPKAWGGE